MDQFGDHVLRSLADADATSSGGSDRRNLRDSLFLAATMSIDGTAHPVRVRNLSTSGLMAEFAQPLAAGTVVGLELRGIGAVGGRVAWATDGRIGIALDRPIDPLAARKPVGASQGGAAPRKPLKPLF